MTIYGYGGYLFYKATKIFQGASLQFNMEWNTTAYRLHLIVVITEVLASSLWAIGFFVCSAYQASNAYEARQIELGCFCVYLAGHVVVLAAILLNVALSQSTTDVSSDGSDQRISLRKSFMREQESFESDEYNPMSLSAGSSTLEQRPSLHNKESLLEHAENNHWS